MTQYAVRKSSDVENFMTSVERVMTYTKLDPEPGYDVERRPPEHWPGEGNITFQDVSLTYYPGGPQVLKKINLNIKGGAKIGVPGRTGAGKSSFVAALLRMPEGDGEIMVDGVNITRINLQQARRCISVLGQSPVLFSGSLRKNLDLVEKFQDMDLWRVLEDVQLKDLVERLDGQFPASRGLSRRDKLKREERDLCRLPTSCLMKPPTKFLVETYRFSKPVSFNV